MPRGAETSAADPFARSWPPLCALTSYLARRRRCAIRDGAVGAALAAYPFVVHAFNAWMDEALRAVASGGKMAPMEPFPMWVRDWGLPLIRMLVLIDASSAPQLPLVADQFTYDQAVTERPFPFVQACVQAFSSAKNGLVDSARYQGWGRELRTAFVMSNDACCLPRAQRMTDDELGPISVASGQNLVEQWRWAGRSARPGRRRDYVNRMFCLGVASAFARAGLRAPTPLDLAEIAVVWGIDPGGPRTAVLNRWKSRADTFRSLLKVKAENS
jgi:hypothetical protein